MQMPPIRIKLYFFILFLLGTITTNAQIANSLEKRLVYRLDYQPDTTDSKRIETEFFLLDFSDKRSVFRSEATHVKDSILNADNPNNLLGTPKTQFRYTIVKKSENNTIISYYDYTTFKFIVENEPVILDWEIQEESKEILGYTCLAATTNFKGRTYTAFFTESIPVSDGPYKFKGLPGMILELYDTENHFHFKTIAVQNLPAAYNYHLSRFEGYKTISKKELLEFEEKVKEKPSLILMNPGIQLSPEAYEKYDRNHRERNKSRNNPIERTLD